MSIMTREGFSQLKFSYLVFVVGLGVAVFLVGGSYLYWQSEKKNNTISQRTLSDMQARLVNAQREKEDLQNSEETYNTLAARGLFVPEQRLDLLEAMEQLKIRHELNTLEYTMSSQRPLKLAAGASVSAVDVLGSRIRVKATSQHDGDLIAFLDEFPRIQRGLFPLDRCVIKRKSRLSANVEGSLPSGILGAAVSAASNLARQQQTAQPSDQLDEVRIEAQQTDKASLELDCTLEWITLIDKRAPEPPKTTATISSGGKL